MMTVDYRKLLVTLMERLKKTSSIVIGKLFPLSLDTFTSVENFILEIVTDEEDFSSLPFRSFTLRIDCMLLLAIQNEFLR